MLNQWRKSDYLQHSQSMFCGAVLFSLVAILTACSTDVVRFDAPSLGFQGSRAEQQPNQLHSDGSLFDQNPDEGPAAATSYTPSTGTTVPVERAQLAQVSPQNSVTYSPAQNTGQPPAGFNNLSRRDAAVQLNGSSSAPSSVTVQRGDTLYTIARRYNVTVATIKKANGLTNNVIRPGQQLYLSAGGATAAYTNSARQTPASAAEIPASPRRTHTVQQGETLYSISRLTGVRIAELKKLNNIDDPRRLRPGQVLSLAQGYNQADTAIQQARAVSPVQPGYGGGTSVNSPIVLNPQASNVQGKQRITQPAASASRIDNPTYKSGDNRTAAKQPVSHAAPDRNRDRLDGKLNFRWPVTGRIIRGFGRRSDGTNNDGINIAVPAGTNIKASEKGTVAYAGNELQGYGNLILIRHAKGYVSVYAHLDSISAQRGDTVNRGQIIAKAGKTGSVQHPQLHFELRQGAKPIDPMPHLGRM